MYADTLKPFLTEDMGHLEDLTINFMTMDFRGQGKDVFSFSLVYDLFQDYTDNDVQQCLQFGRCRSLKKLHIVIPSMVSDCRNVAVGRK